MAADANGVYVVSTGSTYVLRKYDVEANELWTSRFGVPAGLRAGVAVDVTGVYVSGTTAGTLPGQASPGGWDAFVRKYDTQGNELWTRQFGTPTNDFVAAMAADETGVYTIDSSWRVLGQNYISVLRKFDLDGNPLWARQLVSGFHEFSMATDGSSLYVVGYTGPDGQTWRNGQLAFPFLRKYSTGGNELWTQCFGGSPGIVDNATADATGVYVGGEFNAVSFLRKYDPDGRELWTTPIQRLRGVPGPSRYIAMDATGVYMVASTIKALPGQCYAGRGDIFVRKYDALTGNDLWTRQFGTSGNEYEGGVAVNETGIYVAGNVYRYGERSGDEGFLAKLVTASGAIEESKPRILGECVLNAASNIGGGVASGEIVTILGSAMGPLQLTSLRVTDQGRLDTILAGARILFNGVPAPLLYVSEQKSSAIVPHDVADRTSVDVQVEYQGIRSDAVTIPVLANRPGIFTTDSSGKGQAAIVNEDGSLNSPSNPAPPGSIVSIYATGGGATDPPGEDGRIVGGALPRLKSRVAVAISDNIIAYPEVDGGSEDYRYYAQILYAGGSPGSVEGLVQINARVPAGVPPGSAVPLHITIGDSPEIEQSLTIAIGQ